MEPDLFGKIFPGDVIEILGDSNCGKTELLYHLCAKATFPPFWKGIELNGLELSVLFIDTDQKFSFIRLMTILENRLSTAVTSTTERPSNNDTIEFLKTCLSRVKVINCKSTDDLIITLHGLDEILSSQEELISLILIDSVSAFYWADKMSYMDPPKKFYDYYAKLAKASQHALNTFKMVLVATKQSLVQSNNATENDYNFMGRAWEKLVTKSLKLIPTPSINETKLEIVILSNDKDCVTINACIDICGLKFK